MTIPPEKETGKPEAQERAMARLRAELADAHDELNRTNSELIQLTLELEDRVAERTRALRISEAELRKHRDQLQSMVDERTRDLRQVNRRLANKLGELQSSEERFRILVLTIPDIVYRIDGDGCFLFLNEAIRRLGYEPEDLIGRHFNEILLPSERDLVGREAVLPRFAGLKTGDQQAPKLFDERRTGDRKTNGLELRLMVKGQTEARSGYLIPITEETVVVEVNSSGLWEIKSDRRGRHFIGTVGVIRDISDRKKIETALSESEDRLRTIVDHAQAAILVVDAESRKIVEANPAAARMIGLSAERMIGRVCHGFLCADDRGRCPVLDLGQRVNNAEHLLITADGRSVTVLKTAARIHLNGRPHLLESFVDISDLKRAEARLEHAKSSLEEEVEARTAELKRSQAKLIQAEKVAALGTLTAGIAHELNNPMMGMLNFIQYCIKHTRPENRIHGVLVDAEQETRRCITIVQNLLTFSRVESPENEPFRPASLGLLIDRVCRLLSYRIEKENVALHLDMDERLPEVPLKVGNFQQVILNLLGNALDAVKNSRDKRIDLSAAVRDGVLRIAVSDSGAGISPEHRDYVLDPFFTTKPVGQGTGLGLSVSQGIVHNHGGALSFESEPGHGATFVIELPMGLKSEEGGLNIEE